MYKKKDRFKSPLLCLLLSSLGFCSSFAWAFQSTIEYQNLSSEELYRAQKAIAQVSGLLPNKMKTHLKHIHFKFESLDRLHNGLVRGQSVIINKNLLQNIPQSPGYTVASKHPDHPETMLHATLIHEISHLYDQLNILTPEEKRLQNFCQQYEGVNLASCRHIRSRTHSVSQNWDFLLNSGWLINSDQNSVSSGNTLRFRSPDHYEFKNPKEAFAVNMEFFLLDPDFKCRKPSLYRALKNVLEHDPSPTVSCHNFSKHFFLNIGSSKISGSFIEVPIERLYQIHWLHAGNGPAFMSKFGHSMLRLVICAPGKNPDETCLNDVDHHLVLNFRASVEDSMVSNIRGANGDYPSILFVSPFMNIRNEYNRDEFRNLESYPLRLTQQEMQDVLDVALEIHWSYEGRYYFFSNNCAVETINLLKKALGRSSLEAVDSVRPDSALEELKSTDLLDQTKVIAYQGHQAIYENHLIKLKNFGIVRPDQSLDGWMSVKETERLEWARNLLREGPQEAIAPFLAIEMRNASILHRTSLSYLAAEIEKQAKKGGSSEQMDPQLSQLMTQKSALLAQLRSAGRLLGNHGYGRPTNAEVLEFLKSAKVEEIDRTIKRTSDSFNKQMRHEMGQDLKDRLRTVYQILVELQSGFAVNQSQKNTLEKLKLKSKSTN